MSHSVSDQDMIGQICNGDVNWFPNLKLHLITPCLCHMSPQLSGPLCLWYSFHLYSSSQVFIGLYLMTRCKEKRKEWQLRFEQSFHFKTLTFSFKYSLQKVHFSIFIFTFLLLIWLSRINFYFHNFTSTSISGMGRKIYSTRPILKLIYQFIKTISSKNDFNARSK